ncbi:MAG: 30S ribosomal protein S9 [Ignisphaera sp.]|nr:30S ribosomal protein S9 [Ignisphaera sp.]MCX8167824.1 30S ribosomal protein S9 [Ignisphaera sp.]MDW8085811.1 30S ribosomal protein S9 [Ignisphaera sp.]
MESIESSESGIRVAGAYTQIISGRKIVVSVGKRKTAIARAIIKAGNGRYKVNGIPVEMWPIEMARLKMMEPLMLLNDKLRNAIDIEVAVEGGGSLAQAYAVRNAVARGIIVYFNTPIVREILKEFDRTMISGDPRRTESEKWMRYSARRFRQKSYR